MIAKCQPHTVAECMLPELGRLVWRGLPAGCVTAIRRRDSWCDADRAWRCQHTGCNSREHNGLHWDGQTREWIENPWARGIVNSQRTMVGRVLIQLEILYNLTSKRNVIPYHRFTVQLVYASLPFDNS